MNKYMILMALILALPTVKAGGAGTAVGFGLGGLAAGLILPKVFSKKPSRAELERRNAELEQRNADLEAAANQY